MTLSHALDKALSQRVSENTVQAQDQGADVEAQVVDVDRLGARLERLSVHHPQGGDLMHQVETMPESLRALGAPLRPIEVEPSVGGAILRSDPDRKDDSRFWEVRIHDGGKEASLERFSVEPSQGARTAEPFTLSREQLGKVVDGLLESLGAQK